MRIFSWVVLICILAAVPAHADCSAPPGVESQTVYDFTAHRLTYCNGTSWVAFAGAAGSTGQVQFNSGGTFSASHLLFWNAADKQLGIGTSSPAADIHISTGRGEEGAPGIFIQDPTTDALYGGRVYFDDRGGLNVFKVASVVLGQEGTFLALDRVVNGGIGINTDAPRATLDVNGYGRLKMYSAAPVACGLTYQGAIALTSAAEMCVCTTANAWLKVNSAAACVW